MSREILERGGLYAITDSGLIGGARLLPAAEAALRGGAGLLQYRDKGSDYPRRAAEARALLALCRDYSVPLVINDDIELAAAIKADGVHLGRDDASTAMARARLGKTAIIGISGYNNPQAALTPEADYVAFGRLFDSATKPAAPAADLNIFARARALSDRPLVGIGGINESNAARVSGAGAHWLAVIAGLFAKANIEAAARRLCQSLNEPI